MKKGIIAGGILLGCVLLLGGIAAADISTSGLVEFQVSGDPAGLFSGTVEGTLSASLSADADSWEAGLTAKLENDEATLSLSDAFIQYTAEMATIKMSPQGVSYAIYDLGGDIAEEVGITVTATLDPLTITTVLNNAGDLDWNYGIGAEYSAGTISMGVKYNSVEAVGIQIVGTMDPIVLTGQYASFGDRTGYLAKGEYALAAGSVSVSYKTSLDNRTITDSVDDVAEWVDHAWTVTPGSDAIEGDPFTRITATLADFPITATTLLKLEVVNQDLMDIDYAEGTTFVVETATTLAENFTLTLNLKSAGEDLSYFGKIGVSF